LNSPNWGKKEPGFRQESWAQTRYVKKKTQNNKNDPISLDIEPLYIGQYRVISAGMSTNQYNK